MMPPDDRSEFLALAQNNENVLHSFYREVEFWTGQILDPQPLRLIDSQTYLVNEHMPAFNQLFIKTGDDVQTAEFPAHVLQDLRRAFQRRTRWAIRLEQFVNLKAGLGTPQTPYTVDPDKA